MAGINMIGKDRALFGLARILSVMLVLYQLLATAGGSDPSAIVAEVEQTRAATEGVVAWIYAGIDNWKLLAAAGLSLYSKFYDVFRPLLPWVK